MPPLTSPEKTLDRASWRFLLLAACVLVFAFSLHAKVAIYHQAAQPETSTSAKLWVDGEKVAIPQVSLSISVVWFAALIFWLFTQRPIVRVAVADRNPGMVRAPQLFLRRFLRPPPVG